MSNGDLRGRTKAYALRIIRLVEALPRSRTADVIGKQLLRSATSVGANYRAACRAKSASIRSDHFISSSTLQSDGSSQYGKSALTLRNCSPCSASRTA